MQGVREENDALRRIWRGVARYRIAPYRVHARRAGKIGHTTILLDTVFTFTYYTHALPKVCALDGYELQENVVTRV